MPEAQEIGVPVPTGRFDAATGYWIFRQQSVNKPEHQNLIVDGIVSPAHGTFYAHGAA